MLKDKNEFIGWLPTEIGYMESLQVMDLGEGFYWKGYSSDDFLMYSIFYFYVVGDNEFIGALPTELGNLMNVKAIIIGEL